MRKALIIGEEPKKESKGIEFTHYLSHSSGWLKPAGMPASCFNKVVYLGKCSEVGDMFSAYMFDSGTISIYKGHLNDGTY